MANAIEMLRDYTTSGDQVLLATVTRQLDSGAKKIARAREVKS